jgi:hypothetical protein
MSKYKGAGRKKGVRRLEKEINTRVQGDRSEWKPARQVNMYRGGGKEKR